MGPNYEGMMYIAEPVAWFEGKRCPGGLFEEFHKVSQHWAQGATHDQTVNLFIKITIEKKIGGIEAVAK